MFASKAERIILDYAGADGLNDVLHNLSGVAAAGRFLWTASDEGRTIECLEPDGDGYRLRQQHKLNRQFPNLPDEREDHDDKPAEVDIESLAVCDGALWICGSHCKVRWTTKEDREKERTQQRFRPRPEFNKRASRHLLGKVALKDEGGGLQDGGDHLPFKEKGSLRRALKENRFLKPFIGLPSKENGLDIEGFTTRDGKRLFFGLRGPLVDSFAVVVELEVTGGLKLADRQMVTHFLDLKGLAVRDLAQSGEEILVLAGPVSDAGTPFRLYRWQPLRSRDAQSPAECHHWPLDPEHGTGLGEKPEAICRLDHRGRSGLIVLYDKPNPWRIEGTGYTADWIPLA
jgi:Protein of unknown function (DUF3616)